jgi:hypothetical protein
MHGDDQHTSDRKNDSERDDRGSHQHH